MYIIVDTISILLQFVLSLVLYVALMKNVFPRYLMRVRCSVSNNLGRGIKKCTYPSGRGVVYEPHPSVRKYVQRYAILTNDGYKYIKCCLDKTVKSLKYRVVMFNRKNRIIDIINVSETVGRAGESQFVMLHQDTSYVAFSLTEVNGVLMKKDSLLYCNPFGIVAYAFAVAALSFTELLFVAIGYSELMSLYGQTYQIADSLQMYILPAVVIGAVCCVFLLLYRRKRGVRVAMHEQQ